MSGQAAFPPRQSLGVSHCIAMIDSLDIAALAGLAKLEEIELPGTCVNPQRLLDLPALKKLSFNDRVIKDEGLLAQLRAKGVTIRTFG